MTTEEVDLYYSTSFLSEFCAVCLWSENKRQQEIQSYILQTRESVDQVISAFQMYLVLYFACSSGELHK